MTEQAQALDELVRRFPLRRQYRVTQPADPVKAAAFLRECHAVYVALWHVQTRPELVED